MQLRNLSRRRAGSPQTIINTLFTKADSKEEGAELARSLVTFFPLKYILTMSMYIYLRWHGMKIIGVVCVVVPLPAGVFTPTFVIGGIFGRMIGEAIQVTGVVSTEFEPFEFAILGAAAFSTGVTRAISTAVIIMEVSHNGYRDKISLADDLHLVCVGTSRSPCPSPFWPRTLRVVASLRTCASSFRISFCETVVDGICE